MAATCATKSRFSPAKEKATRKRFVLMQRGSLDSAGAVYRQAIAIDPRQVAVTKTIAGLGKGPGHSLVVLPDKKKAAINVAGDNLIAFLDLEHGSVDSTLQTGAFP